MLEGQARGMGDQLAESGFPSTRAPSLPQAALQGPEWTAVLAWKGSHLFLWAQKSQEPGLPEALGTLGRSSGLQA